MPSQQDFEFGLTKTVGFRGINLGSQIEWRDFNEAISQNC